MIAGITSGTQVTATTSNNGLVKFISNEELDRIEEESILASRDKEPSFIKSDLATYVRKVFDANKRAKADIEVKLLDILRQIKGEYTPEKLSAIKELGGSEDFIKLTQHKVRDCEAWIIDTMNPYGDDTWDIEPTPIASLPESVMSIIRSKVRSRLLMQARTQSMSQGTPFNPAAMMPQMEELEEKIAKQVKKRAQEIAKQKATAMKTKIKDQLAEGKWELAFKACVNDLSRLKSCIFKGPIFKKVPSLKWDTDSDGKYVPAITEETKSTYARVSPFDWFPSAKSAHVNDGDAIEIEHLSISDLRKLVGVKGYKDEIIKTLIKDNPTGHKENAAIELERQELEKDNTIVEEDTDIKFDMLNFWGMVLGEKLIDYGVKEFYGNKIIEDEYYNINIKTINDQLIKDPILNPDPLGLKPYHVTSFIKNNDSQWGDCPAELMDDLQSICNASVRPLINNMAISSGPLTEIDADRLAPGETGELWPHKRIYTTNKRMVAGPAVQFYQAEMRASELLLVYDKFKTEADDIVIPSYGKTNIGGAGRTSSGLSMLMTAAARNVKLAIYNIDQDVVIPAITQQFNYNMLFIDDDSIKGDIRIKAKGTGGLVAKEQLAVRRNEFRASLRPQDEKLLGDRGLAYILSKNGESLDLDIDKLIPGYSEIEELDGLEQMPLVVEGGGPMTPPKPATLDVAGGDVGGSDEASLFRDKGVQP